MTDVVGIVIAIELAIIALILVLTYFHLGRFLETTRITIQRINERSESVEERFNSTMVQVGELLDELKTTAVDIRAKAEIIERDLSPLAQNLDRTLTDANPFVRSMSESSGNFISVSENVKKVSNNFADVVSGLHEAIVPTLNGIRSLLHGISEGLRILKLGRDEDEE